MWGWVAMGDCGVVCLSIAAGKWTRLMRWVLELCVVCGWFARKFRGFGCDCGWLLSKMGRFGEYDCGINGTNAAVVYG